MPQTKIADFVQALGKNVLEKAANELVTIDTAGPPTGRFALLVSEGDGAIVEADDAGVGNSDAEDVSGEIFEDGLLTLAPASDVHDPGRGPDRVGEEQVGTFVNQPGFEFAAHQLGQSDAGNEEAFARGMPVAAIVGDTAAGDQASNCWVQV